MARAVRTQPGERRSLNPVDQFGRLWHTNIEIQTGDPTGGIFPAGWADPLNTPTHYVRVPKTDDGLSFLGRVEVQYDRWIRDHEIEESRWYEQLHQNATTMYKRLEPDQIQNLEHDKFLLDLTGPKPWPSTEVLARAKAGYRPFLGLEPLSAEDRIALGKRTLGDLKTGVVATPAAPAARDDTIPPNTYPEFVGWAMRTKQAKGLKEAAELWHLHAAELTPA